MVFARAGAVATTAVAVRVDDTTITTCQARLPGCCPAPAAFVVMAEATKAQWIALALVLQIESPARRELDWLCHNLDWLCRYLNGDGHSLIVVLTSWSKAATDGCGGGSSS